jgi:hypothetical protein
MQGGHTFCQSTILRSDNIDQANGQARDADGLSRNPLQDDTDFTDARMDHESAPVSPISVSAGLALLAYQRAPKS